MILDERVALVTGAASGIGRALAVALGRRNCRLALVDRDAAGLADTRLAAPIGDARCTLHVADLADPDAIAALVPAVLDAHGGLDVLVNNAGVALGGSFEQVSEADFDWLLDVNFRAPVRLCRAFLPALRRRGEARIVNVSSLFGLVAPSGQTAYAASKFALRGFSESLRHELAGSGVGVTTIHPGGVATAIARRARLPAGTTEAEAGPRIAAMERVLRLPPERAAAAIVRAIERGQPRRIIGRDAQVASLLERLFPVRHLDAIETLRRRAAA